ncbi:hypothetical protein LQ954_12255 [Sphingomonas sp. IC-11]|uniref:hypothetical protein n=1 Tax=Sphingomonas sp. IC-11 TaxID=2898528 RepID=UPI001E5166EF|nr:hypothetical protein [Sphingomonas sp. IC-11]MCD2316923.1 hypothetical protein [Sphingomonas sp. IC-11]
MKRPSPPPHRPKTFSKPKRKIGGNALQRSTRNPKGNKILLHIESVVADASNGPEPNDSVYRGLYGCNTPQEIETLRDEWSFKFNGKARRALPKKFPPQKRATIEALLTSVGSTGAPILTNEQMCREAANMLAASLISQVRNNAEIEVGMITFISGDDSSSHLNPTINLYGSLKRMKKVVGLIRPDFLLGAFELALFNSHGHPDGGQVLQGHGHAIIAGKPGLLRRAEQVAIKQKHRFTPNITGAKAIDIKRVDTSEINLARVANYLFKPPYKCMNWNPGKDGKPGHMNGSEKGDRYIRYLRLAQIRTMMRFEDTLFASGTGVKLRGEIVSFLRGLAKKEGAHGTAVLHPDAIASFWAAIMPELPRSKQWNLPIIKTRH